MLVVQIVVAGLRADVPGFAGGAGETGELDRLAGEGTRFDRMIPSGSFSVPSLVSMVTGSFPHRLGVCRWRHPFPARRPTLMSAFAAAGFDVRVLAYNPRWIFGSCPERGRVGCSQRSEEVVEALRTPTGVDRLVLIHHWWTHLPYQSMKLERRLWMRARDAAVEALRADPEAMVPRLRALYLRAVAFFCAELLPTYLDAATAGGGDVLVLVTGDCGDGWGGGLPPGRRVRHHYDLQGRWLRDGTVTTPLVLWGRGGRGPIPAARVAGGTPRGVDLAPTLADLAGIPWPGPLPVGEGPAVVDRGIAPDGSNLALDGRSLAPAVMEGESVPDRAPLVLSSHNAHVPDEYPTDGRQLWRTLGWRTADRWYVFDGVDGERSVTDLAGGPQVGRPGDGRIWERLEGEWSQAVDPGPTLARGLFPPYRRP